MLLYFIRHGDPIYDPDSLTEKGKLQAEAVGKRLAYSKIDKIYASSSRRAVMTAEPLAAKLGKEIEILDWCNEGYTWNEFTVEENGYRTWLYQSEKYLTLFSSDKIMNMGHKWYEHDAFAETKCREGIERIAENADKFMAGLGYVHDVKNHIYTAEIPNNDRVALFAHEGFSHVFLPYILDIPYPIFAKFEYNHTGMTVVEFRSDGKGKARAKLLQYSNDSHMYKEGLPTEYNNGIVI